MKLTKKLRNRGTLTPKQYQKLREQVGTRDEVAPMTGVAADTLRKREAGYTGYPIDREATVTMLALAGVWE